jgi:hypothetical protein
LFREGLRELFVPPFQSFALFQHRSPLLVRREIDNPDGVVENLNPLRPFAVNLFRRVNLTREINSFRIVGVSSATSVYFRTVTRNA